MQNDRALRGKAIRDEGAGRAGLDGWSALNEICPTHAESIHEYVFGTIWDRPHLDLKTRGLIAIAAATASGHSDEVQAYTRSSLNRNATREEVVEAILQCAPYIGFPKTNHALKDAKEVFDLWETNHDQWKPYDVG